MDISVVVIGSLFSVVSLFFIIVNGIILYKGLTKKENIPSVTPFLGGIAGAIALLIFFGIENWFLIFIPLFIDWGSIPAMFRFIYYIRKDMITNKDNKNNPGS